MPLMIWSYTSNFQTLTLQSSFSLTFPVPINENSVVLFPLDKHFAVNLVSSLFLSYTSNPAKNPVSCTFKSQI